MGFNIRKIMSKPTSTLIKYQEENQQIDHFRVLANIASKGGSGNTDNLMNIMLTARDLGISPMKAINGGFHIIKGKISMSTALMVDRIRKEGHSLKIPEWTSEKCVIIGIRKDNGDSIRFEYTMDDAKAAGLTNSETWKKFPKHMLYNRAMSTIARTLFPDVVGNAYSEDEKWDIMNVPPEERPLENPEETEVSPIIVNTPEEKIETLSDQQIHEIHLAVGDKTFLLDSIFKKYGKKLSQIEAEHFDYIIQRINELKEKK